MLDGFGPEIDEASVAEILVALYRTYRDNDAELLEVNPLARLEDGRLAALDCKLTLDDSAIKRQGSLANHGSPEPLTGLEARGQVLGLKYIELDGDVGVIANGAGLTMTTMDVITHHGGRAANFLEIGGEAYTKARPALELVLANPRVTCLVVNFCGAFARTGRDDRRRAGRVGSARSVHTSLLQRARHGLGRGARDAPAAPWGHPVPDHGRGNRRGSRRGPGRGRRIMIVRGGERGARPGDYREAGYVLDGADAGVRHERRRGGESEEGGHRALRRAGMRERPRCNARSRL